MEKLHNIKGIFFDLGGTLRIALLEEPWISLSI